MFSIERLALPADDSFWADRFDKGRAVKFETTVEIGIGQGPPLICGKKPYDVREVLEQVGPGSYAIVHSLNNRR